VFILGETPLLSPIINFFTIAASRIRMISIS
jgi:hypothetical protein